jgi:hypothetical protein
MGSSKKPLEIRRLRAEDVRNYRAVLVEALIVHPDCFTEDYNAEIARPLSETEDELEHSATFGVWLGNVLAGIGSAVPCRTSKRQHCGTVRNLYVREKFRHAGIARLLMREILLNSTRDVKQLEAQVPLLIGTQLCPGFHFGYRTAAVDVGHQSGVLRSSHQKYHGRTGMRNSTSTRRSHAPHLPGQSR